MVLSFLLVLATTPLERAGAWLAAFPVEELRFDAAVGLSQVVKLRPADASLAEAFRRARGPAEKDADHPQLRFWVADAGIAKGAVSSWSATDPKVNLNRPVDEALWCDVHGLRPQTLKYVSGPMRDGGGYRSTHALWALGLARERGCLDAKAFGEASAAVRAELRKAQPADIGPKTLDVDLYAERLLFLLLAGERDATLEGWAKKLLERQNAEGSFGPLSERRYEQHHATLVATWALALLEQRPAR